MASLLHDLWPAIFQDDIGCGSRSAHIASCFLELEKVNQDLESKLRNDFNNILNSMDAFSLSPTPRPLPTPPVPPTRTISSVNNPSFTVAAYSWLLENIANPYPSSGVKGSLAQQHNCALSAVNTWFINARRRIGWTALCRDHFNNCRADTLGAAFRAIVEEDPDRPLPPNIIHAFVGVKATTESFYSAAVTNSALAGDLDAVLGGVSDQGVTLTDERKNHEPEGAVESSEASETEPRNSGPVAQHHYASPDSSCFSSPVPPLDESLTDDSKEEAVLPPVLAGRKRRLSCSELPHATALSTKRKRNMCPTNYSPTETRISSSGESLENLTPHPKTSSTIIPRDSNDISASPKRRDAKICGHPHELTIEPGLHSASEPLSLTTLESEHSVDEWFNSYFDTLFSLPPPVDLTEPDLSAHWEVELFNNYTIPSTEPQRKSLNPPDGYQASVSANPLTPDDFLQSLRDGGSVAPPEAMYPPITFPAVEIVPQDLSLSPESIDWAALLNLPTFDPSLDPIFGQSHTDSLPLPEIDLSVLQLPGVLS